MQVVPYKPEGYQLLHEGALTFSEMQQNGIKMNVSHLKSEYKRLGKEVNSIKSDLESFEETKLWRKTYGSKFALDSDEQLADILYEKIGYEAKKFTDTGAKSVDHEALSAIQSPMVDTYLRYRKLEKARTTYIKNLLKETQYGYLHPNMMLHTARTFRSSSSNPNIQNQPTRDPEIGKIIRKAFIPRKDSYLVAADYGGIEVKGSCFYHEDPTMLEYMRNPESSDMHSDFACLLFILDSLDESYPGEKTLRKGTKNGFTFPQFYGDYYGNNAISLWDWMGLKGNKINPKHGQILKTGETVGKHLIKNGIKNYRQFEKHVQNIEKDMWENRFPVYKKWRNNQYKSYLKNGYVTILSGFVCSGMIDRNATINYPIQGCLEGNSKVLTDKGHIPIKKLVNKKVKVWTGFNWAFATGVNRGKCQRANITLESGLVIKCDTRHKLKNENHQWIDFKNLSIGDYIALPRTPDVILPSNKMTWDFILGFIIGDGALCKNLRSSGNSYAEFVSITVGEKKKRILKNIQRFLSHLGFGGYKKLKVRSTKDQKYTLRIEDKNFVYALKNEGMVFGCTAHTKNIPESIWTKSFQNQRDFLEGIWKSDGSTGKWQENNLHMCNKNLLQEIQILASPLGFDSALKSTKTGWKLSFSFRDKNKKPVRKIPSQTIHNLININDVKTKQGDNDSITEKRLIKSNKDISQYVGERLIDKYNPKSEIYRYDKIISIDILDHQETTYTMSVENSLHQFVADGVVHKNTCFHCLLWSCIELNKKMKKEKMRSKLIFQVHDEIIADVKKDEYDDYLSLLKETMVHDLKEHFTFINVPMEIEVEASALEGNWFEMEKVLHYIQ
jgi:hypothetical protein